LLETCERVQIKEDSNKHIIKEIVRQVGYLPELHEDARPEKYIKTIKIQQKTIVIFLSLSS
jgi:hypothetical protein